MFFSLIWLISYEFLTSKGDDICRKIVKEEYFTLLDQKCKTHGVVPG